MFEDSGPSARIEFYRANGPFGELSNLWPGPLEFEDRRFRCSEYAYQYGKPNKQEVKDWLMAAPHPRLCAAAAHALFVYDVVPEWSRLKVPRMRDVLLAKLATYPPIVRLLVGTGDALLVEASKSDAFWGIGASGKGQNMLGVLWMEWRVRIQQVSARQHVDALGAVAVLWQEYRRSTCLPPAPPLSVSPSGVVLTSEAPDGPGSGRIPLAAP